MRLKTVTAGSLEVLLEAIEQDAANYMQKQSLIKPNIKLLNAVAPEELGGLAENAPIAQLPSTSGIVNLRFEDCQIQSKATAVLK